MRSHRQLFKHAKTLVSLSALLLSACDPASNPSDLGVPIFVIHGQTTGSLTTTVSAPRVALLWSVYTDAYAACLDNAESDVEAFFGCIDQAGSTEVAAQSVALTSGFPSSFELPVYALPALEYLNGTPGAYYGQGFLVIYDDLNGNGKLDMLPIDALDSVDTILSGNHRDNRLVYREGALSPLWRMHSIEGCSEPGQGFSVEVFDPKAELNCDGLFCMAPCAVTTGGVLTLKLGAESAADREIVCPSFSMYTSEQPPIEQPYVAEAEPVCQMRGYSVIVNTDAQRYCSQANTHQYDLVDWDQQWNLSANPPSWWPCELTAPVQGDPIDIIGVYEVQSQLRNENGCEEPATSVTDGPSHFKIVENAFMSDILGTTTLSLYPCSSVSVCADEFDANWGYIQWIPQYGGWTSLVSSRQNYDNVCAIVDSYTTVERNNDDITLRLTISNGSVELTHNQSCQILDDLVVQSHLVCSSLEVIQASIVH